jgi:NAD(P)-dependent dehydrogenase (short-subunit alcohol dehydrogenase family)
VRLQEKVALVTGAADSRSIGWGIARALADEGADVVVNDVAHLDDLEKRAAELRIKGRRALAVPGDISKPDQVAAMIARAVSEMGRLDILVNSAGIIRWEPFVDITADGFRAIVDVNLKGNVLICKAARP